VQIRIDIDPALAKAVEDIAGQTGQPFSALVNEALRRTLPQLQPPRSGRIQGWLEDNDPFFRIMDRIESERHARKARDPITFD